MRSPRIPIMVLLFLGSFGVVSPLPAQTPSVLTRQNDNQHTGQNLHETILTPTNVNSGSFGKVFSYPVDGQIWTQPLYVPNLNVGTKGNHNVIYVATENAKVYALDADSAKKNPESSERAGCAL